MAKSLDYVVFLSEIRKIGASHGHALELEYPFAKELSRQEAAIRFPHYHKRRRKSDGLPVLREFRFDAAFPSARLAIEINGGAFKGKGGGHNRGAGYRDDLEKMNLATLLGWRVLAYLPEQLLKTALRDVGLFFDSELTQRVGKVTR